MKCYQASFKLRLAILLFENLVTFKVQNFDQPEGWNLFFINLTHLLKLKKTSNHNHVLISYLINLNFEIFQLFLLEIEFSFNCCGQIKFITKLFPFFYQKNS